MGLRFRPPEHTPGQTILQVGAGVGYFTAILAELTGSEGRVIAYEIDEELAQRAQSNVARYAHVEVISGDATQAVDLPDLDIVVAFAGVTHVPEPWLSNLSDAGRMALPFTDEDQWGFREGKSTSEGLERVRSYLSECSSLFRPVSL